MTPATRWALRAYPPSFRDRYGDELEALTEDVTSSWRHTAGLYVGAGRAWLRPAYAGPDATRRRLQATVSAVWVAWCAGFLLAPAITKALLDPAGPGVDATVRRLVTVSGDLFVAGWIVALTGAALLVARALVPALRTRRWTALRPLVPATVLGIVEAGGLVGMALAQRFGGSMPSPASVVLGVAWLVGLLAFLVTGGFGPAVTIRRLQPDTAVLRVPTVLAAALAICLAAMTATSATAVLVAGQASLVGLLAPVIGVVAVGLVASTVALVSSTRGVLALRTRA